MSRVDGYTRLSSKGQVVLPRDLRVKLRLKEGAELAVRISGHSIILEPVKRTDVKRTWRRWRGALKGTDLLKALAREHQREIRTDARRA